MRKMAHWRDADTTNYAWLAEGRIPADPVCDLDTQDNAMSVFISDSGIRTIEQLAAAFIANGDSLRDFEYVTFESEDVADAGIEVSDVLGNTPDTESNRLHRDLVRISAQSLVALTAATLRRGVAATCDRVPRKEVAVHILRGVEEGWLDRAQVKPKVLESATSDCTPSLVPL
jgi:hypothetical protein